MTDAAQYLLVLYIAEHRHSPPVSSGTVAEMLDKSTATVTGTFQRLHRDGLVEYESYEDARLTEPTRHSSRHGSRTGTTAGEIPRSRSRDRNRPKCRRCRPATGGRPA